jgi:hypothetical protein
MASPEERFKQTISYKARTGLDAWGKPTYGTVSTTLARVQPSRKIVKDDAGNDVQSAAVVYTKAALTMQHRVWFPGEDTSDANKGRRPLAIDVFTDGNGAESYRKVWF